MRDGKCWTHYDQLRRRGRVTVTKDRRKAGLTPLERLTEAAITYAEAPDDDDRAWRRALDNLCASAERYTTKLWRDRAREALARARRQKKHVGRPAKTGDVSRWTRWRRQRQARWSLTDL